MTLKTVSSLALAAGCALAIAMPAAQAQMMETQIHTNAPRVNAGDRADWLAARNNAESREYMRLLQSNWNFRQARMQKECGSITDEQLHASCIASFDRYTPFSGSTRLAGNEWYPPNSQPMPPSQMPPSQMTGTTGTMAPFGAGTDVEPPRTEPGYYRVR